MTKDIKTPEEIKQDHIERLLRKQKRKGPSMSWKHVVQQNQTINQLMIEAGIVRLEKDLANLRMVEGMCKDLERERAA